MLKQILDAAKSLLGFKETLRKADLEKRERIANFLNRLAETTKNVAHDLKKGLKPAGHCSKMQAMARELEGIAQGHSIEWSLELSDIFLQLIEAHDAGVLLWEIEKVPNPDEEFRKLEEAAGLLEGLAESVRARG